MQTLQKLRKHTCPTCARSYVKAEHLIRHQRTHTGVKAFICDDCGSQFTRSDSLARHVRRSHHDDLPQRRKSAEEPLLYDSSAACVDGEVASAGLPDTGSNQGIVNQVYCNNDQSVEIIDDPFLHLTWPDSEALLQSILNNRIDNFPADLELLPLQPSPWLPQNDTSEHSTNAEAVRDVSQIIADVSANVTSDAGSVSLTTVFLDECLHLFFDQFVPILPVLHRPTFQYREWTHPLLLNAIALGSLFLGEEKHVTQGEALWKLAHVAVATSWNTLMQHKTPEDHRHGIQLVTTALLGQTYAMLSGNQKLRKTAQMFHSLGFYWARECDLYTRQRALDNLAAIGVDGAVLYRLWKQWVAEELQLRTLLGHYILDSQLAQFISAPTSQRHASSSLPLPCSDQLFSASSARDWADALLSESVTTVTFRELFLRLYATESQLLPPDVSCLALKVVLEGLRAVILESQTADGPVLGVPSASATSLALGAVYTYLCSAPHLSKADEVELILRWHSICIDAITDSVAICQELCSVNSIPQEVFGQRKGGGARFSLSAWPSSAVAREAILHASAVYDNIDKLPISHAHAIHIPMSIFIAAIVYCAFILGGITTVAIPDDVEWSTLGLLGRFAAGDNAHEPLSFDPRSAAGRFVLGQSHEDGSGKFRNLKYELNVFLLRLRQTAQPWGLSTPLAAILKQLIACRTN